MLPAFDAVWATAAEQLIEDDTERVDVRGGGDFAGLEHPNIARLLDGGTTDDGLPYFVLEYVEGEPIDAYCDERKLSVRDRLRLFEGVCAAVQYAHRSLVVHRDLKPANMLVTAEGVPKLLDFGIAKLLNSEVAGTSAETVVAMTPDYASPEQVRGRPNAGPTVTKSSVTSDANGKYYHFDCDTLFELLVGPNG